MRVRHAAVVSFLVLLASARAAADPAPSPEPPQLVQTVEPRLLCKPPEPPTACITLRPGRFLDEQSWQHVDTEHKRLEDALTRSDAENKSLRKSAEGWRPGWVTITSAVLSGIALGVYIAR